MNNQEMKETILNKKFNKTVFAGYETTDVDAFFDLVIDYLNGVDIDVAGYKKTAEALKQENDKLKSVVVKQESKIKNLFDTIKQYEDDGFTNVLENRKQQEELDAQAKKENK